MSDSSAEFNRPRRARIWTWVLVIVVLLAVGYWLIGRKGSVKQRATNSARAAAMASAAVPVKIATVVNGRINVTLKTIGTVTAFNTVTVQSRVAGPLQKVAFIDGQKVNQGDLLARIDPSTYQVQLEQAQGTQKQNQAQLRNAQRDLQRYQLLFKQNSIAKQQVDAQAALVQQFLGTEKSDQAAVDSAKLQLDFTRITAPISGRLGLRMVDQGNLISTTSTSGLVVITQTQPISVIFTLPQSQLPDVLAQRTAGTQLAVDLYDRDDHNKIASGELMAIDNQIDVTTGTVKLKARFANEDESLFPNQFVNVHLHVSSNDAALLAPTMAVQQGSIGSFVYLVNQDDKVHVQPVVTGTVDGQNVGIKSGLSAGQRVVIEGVDRLREGATVSVVSPTPVAAPPSASAPPASVSHPAH
ncbi:MAG: MdtA/MuxA family multidrug efflux RND transporter periplasmic adaptor subunit [Burkholderiaceae bacterium]